MATWTHLFLSGLRRSRQPLTRDAGDASTRPWPQATSNTSSLVRYRAAAAIRAWITRPPDVHCRCRIAAAALHACLATPRSMIRRRPHTLPTTNTLNDHLLRLLPLLSLRYHTTRIFPLMGILPSVPIFLCSHHGIGLGMDLHTAHAVMILSSFYLKSPPNNGIVIRNTFTACSYSVRLQRPPPESAVNQSI